MQYRKINNSAEFGKKQNQAKKLVKPMEKLTSFRYTKYSCISDKISRARDEYPADISIFRGHND